jgi:hypothetical protein
MFYRKGKSFKKISFKTHDPYAPLKKLPGEYEKPKRNQLVRKHQVKKNVMDKGMS